MPLDPVTTTTTSNEKGESLKAQKTETGKSAIPIDAYSSFEVRRSPALVERNANNEITKFCHMTSYNYHREPLYVNDIRCSEIDNTISNSIVIGNREGELPDSEVQTQLLPASKGEYTKGNLYEVCAETLYHVHKNRLDIRDINCFNIYGDNNRIEFATIPKTVEFTTRTVEPTPTNTITASTLVPSPSTAPTISPATTTSLSHHASLDNHDNIAGQGADFAGNAALANVILHFMSNKTHAHKSRAGNMNINLE